MISPPLIRPRSSSLSIASNKGNSIVELPHKNQPGNGKLRAQFPSPINQSTGGPRVAIAAGGRSGHYCIPALLGADGVGEVWLARDRRLNREVTIKVLPGPPETATYRFCARQGRKKSLSLLV